MIAGKVIANAGRTVSNANTNLDVIRRISIISGQTYLWTAGLLLVSGPAEFPQFSQTTRATRTDRWRIRGQSRDRVSRRASDNRISENRLYGLQRDSSTQRSRGGGTGTSGVQAIASNVRSFTRFPRNGSNAARFTMSGKPPYKIGKWRTHRTSRMNERQRVSKVSR